MAEAYETYASTARENRNLITVGVSYKTYMAGKADRDPVIVARGDRLRRARIAANYDNPADAIRDLDFNENSYYLHENGRATFSFKYAQTRYAPAYGVSAEWLYSGKGAMLPDAGASVPIMGSIAAGFEGDFDPDFAGDPTSWLDIEPSEGRIALRVSGDSMTPFAHDGDIAVFGPTSPDPQPWVNKRVMAQLADGRKLFKILRPGRETGTYDLYSLNSAYDPIEDAKLEWVLPLERLHVR